MRLFVFNCLLLASVAVALPNGRHKRDLSYLKNLITSAIFGRSQINIQPTTVLQEENGYKLFRLPGYDDIMIKVAPKKPILEEFVYPPATKQVNLNAFGTVVGTKSKDDTLGAVKEVDNLLSTGILYGGHNTALKDTIVPMFPSLNNANYVVEEKLKPDLVLETRPVFTEVIQPRPVLTEVIETRPVHTELIEPRPVNTELIETRPVLTEVIEPRPAFTEVIRPLEEKIELKVPFEPTYSYKQMQNNEPVMTYTAHNNPGVEVLETIKMKNELPMCIKKRVDEAILLGSDPNRFGQKVYQNSFPVQEVFQYQSPPVLDFSYPTPQRLRPIKDTPVRYNIRPTKTKAINPSPVPLHSHKSLHIEENISATKDKVNSQPKKVQAFTTLGEKVDISQTLGPIPPQYIHMNSKDGNLPVPNTKKVQQLKAVPIVSSKDNVSNAQIPINVYKLQSNPNTGKLVKENNVLRTNIKANTNQFVVTPAVNGPAPKKDNIVKNIVHTNKVTVKPPSVTRPIVVASTNSPKQNPLRENIQTAIINKPTVVKDNKNYSYQQKNADGSSVSVLGSKHGVSVNVRENNNRGRGDIPDFRE